MASIARPPHGLQETVKALLREKKSTPTDEQEDGAHPQTPPLARSSDLHDSQREQNGSTAPQTFKQRSPRPSTQSRRWSASTPSGRTGPPRSISFNYSVPGSHPASRENSTDERAEQPHIKVPSPTAEEEDEWEDPDHASQFAPARSPFRSALEYSDPEQREKEREIVERRYRRKDSFSYFHDVINPSKWVTDSPKEEHSALNLPGRHSEHQGEKTSSPISTSPVATSPVATSPTPGSPVTDSSDARHARGQNLQSPAPSAAVSPRLSNAGRSRSVPHFKQEGRSSAAPGWSRLRSFLPSLAAQGRKQTHGPSAVVSQSVNITDELIAGGLSSLLLRLWFERDEKDHRRVPILFHRLRIRVSDSLHPLHGHKAVFRIECEYANGAARWVVYRQLREFISLHTHYTFSNAYNRNVETLPDFPRAGENSRQFPA
jgi:phospholipase D1/2